MPDVLPQYVRVRDKATNHQYSVVASTFDEEHMELLDKAAVQCDGTPLAPKHYIAPRALSSKETNTGQQAGASDKEKRA